MKPLDIHSGPLLYPRDYYEFLIGNYHEDRFIDPAQG